MNLGAFSVSLAVKDLTASQSFYETLGFTCFGGDPAHGYVIMKNGDHLIGLFQGMFDQNILTFNPGWTQDAQPTQDFDDVREIHKTLAAHGLQITDANLAQTTGPGSFMVADPDGNHILIDQHR